MGCCEHRMVQLLPGHVSCSENFSCDHPQVFMCPQESFTQKGLHFSSCVSSARPVQFYSFLYALHGLSISVANDVGVERCQNLFV